MREVITTGKTVEAATEAACLELGKTRDEVSVEILEMPVKKFFRSIPAKVKVSLHEEKIQEKPPVMQQKETNEEKQNQSEKVQEKKNTKLPIEAESEGKTSVLEKEEEIEINISENAAVQNAVNYLQNIYKALGAENMKILAYQQGEATLFRTEGNELSQLLEIRGDTIQALSYLVDRSVNRGVDKKDEQYLKIRLDVEGYRDRREQELISLAKRTAEEVLKTKRNRTLAPMNPYERLIIHTAIGEIKGVVSESIGNDLERRVVIRSVDSKRSDRDRGRGKKSSKRPKSNARSGYDKREKRDYGSAQKSTTAPPREFAEANKDVNAEPIVPKRRESISDGADLPLYGKIEL